MRIKITENGVDKIVSTQSATDKMYEITKHRVPRFDLLVNIEAMDVGKSIGIGDVIFTAVE